MTNEDEGYGLVEPFDIDNGQLDGIPPQTVFTLGVEWEMFRQKLTRSEPFKELVHTFNVERIIAMCERQGRFCESTPALEKFGEWSEIIVGSKKET